MRARSTFKLSAAILVFLTSLHLQLQSQNIAVQPGFNSFGGELQYMSDGTIRVIGLAADDWWYGQAFVSTVHYDMAGNHISSRMFPGLSRERGFSVNTFPTRQGHTIAAASVTGCDYGVPLTVGRISDQNTLDWFTIIKFGEFADQFTFEPVSDSTFYVSDGWGEGIYSQTGQMINDPDAVIYDKVLLDRNGYMMSLGTRFFVCDTHFIEQNEIDLSHVVIDFDTTHQRGYFVATTDSLFVLDSQLEKIRSRKNVFGSINHVFTTSQNYWFFRGSGSQFYKLDSLLEVDTVYSHHPSVLVTDVLHVSDTIFILGNFTPRDQSMVLLRMTQDSFDQEFPTDIGIVKTRLTQDAVAYNSDWPPYDVKNIDYGPVYITLHNYGTTVIDETYVRFQELACPGICAGILQYEWHLKDLNILPGANKEVLLGHLYFECAYFDFNNLCLYTINPNGEPDMQNENDSHCITVDIISDIDDVSDNIGIRVFPNPSSDILYVEYETKSTSVSGNISLIDFQGKTVLQTPFLASGNRIYLDRIPPGVYSVLVQTSEGKSVVRRVVVI